ncbi:hypothetical protein [Subtercola boreus]|uniref:hypothetical protein n=1 Tax=Subtercola boreus TaxID=120213 RepID=UPI000E2FE3F5|nr:hypothetical protein [Subtercola boreus]
MLITALTFAGFLIGDRAALAIVVMASVALLLALLAAGASVWLVLGVRALAAGAAEAASHSTPRAAQHRRNAGAGVGVTGVGVTGVGVTGVGVTGVSAMTEPPRLDVDAVVAAMEGAFSSPSTQLPAVRRLLLQRRA